MTRYPLPVEPVPEEIRRHYESIDEGLRITEGFQRLEMVRTREIILRHLPDHPCRIIDIGGGTGVHAEWLATEGHDVHVVDLVPDHVETVSRLSPSTGTITAEAGDARQLTAADASFDAALLLGPLYHLTEREDRLRAWAEAHRVVRAGGHVFVAAISRFASLFDGLARGYLFEPDFRKIVERDLRDGQHRNPTEVPHRFTTAYFHLPHELSLEASEAGLEVAELVGVEGLAGWLPQLANRWATEEGREAIMYSARVVESEPTLLGLSSHLLLVARVSG